METWSYHLRMGAGAVLKHSTLSSDGDIGSPGNSNNFRIRIEASFQSILPPIAGIPGKKYRQDSFLDTEVVLLLER